MVAAMTNLLGLPGVGGSAISSGAELALDRPLCLTTNGLGEPAGLDGDDVDAGERPGEPLQVDVQLARVDRAPQTAVAGETVESLSARPP